MRVVHCCSYAQLIWVSPCWQSCPNLLNMYGNFKVPPLNAMCKRRHWQIVKHHSPFNEDGNSGLISRAEGWHRQGGLDSNEKKFDFSRNSTIPETNGLHPKIEGSKRNIYFWDGLFSGANCCFFRDECAVPSFRKENLRPVCCEILQDMTFHRFLVLPLWFSFFQAGYVMNQLSILYLKMIYIYIHTSNPAHLNIQFYWMDMVRHPVFMYWFGASSNWQPTI